MIRYNPKIEDGLTSKQVTSQIKKGFVNYDFNVKTKSIWQIILYNSFVFQRCPHHADAAFFMPTTDT